MAQKEYAADGPGKADAFWRQPHPNVKADDHLSVIAFNSTYVEFIDRWFKIRGSIYDFGYLIAAAAGCYMLYVGFHVFLDLSKVLAIFMWLIGLSGIGLCLAAFLLFEFFTYTHWPIRFNRQNRMVYVFKHNCPGGVLRVPFDDVFFHLGQDTSSKTIVDVRGEVLDGDIVVDTFAAGNFLSSGYDVAEIWGFIRTYMDEGRTALNFPYIYTSVNVSWYNAAVRSAISLGGVPLAYILFPFYGIKIVLRWLALKSSKTPAWPADVETECHVAENDPFDLPQPQKDGEFMNSPTTKPQARL